MIICASLCFHSCNLFYLGIQSRAGMWQIINLAWLNFQISWCQWRQENNWSRLRLSIGSNVFQLPDLILVVFIKPEIKLKVFECQMLYPSNSSIDIACRMSWFGTFFDHSVWCSVFLARCQWGISYSFRKLLIAYFTFILLFLMQLSMIHRSGNITDHCTQRHPTA